MLRMYISRQRAKYETTSNNLTLFDVSDLISSLHLNSFFGPPLLPPFSSTPSSGLALSFCLPSFSSSVALTSTEPEQDGKEIHFQ